MKKFIFKGIGYSAFTLGVLGMFLPLLPSTCFILLAAWAFSKSSPKFYDWLYSQSPFASSIQNWQQHKCIPRKIKLIATMSILVSFIFTTIVVNNLMILSILGLGMIGLLTYLLTRPEKTSSKTTFEYNPQLRPQVN